MRSTRLIFGLLASIVALVVLACGGGGEGGGDLRVEVREWSVQPAREEGSSGSFTIELANQGTRPHQLLIVKSDLPPEMLPAADGRMDEALVNVVARIESVAPGASQTLEAELSPGKYVLLCNVVERPATGPVQSHYLNGMAASFLIDQ